MYKRLILIAAAALPLALLAMPEPALAQSHSPPISARAAPCPAGRSSSS